MAIEGRFNTDAGALDRRIQAHEKFGGKDLNQWIFHHLKPGRNMMILDLGCGTGKQTIPLAEIVGEKGRVTALDISQEALESLSANASEKGVRNIQILLGRFDELESLLKGASFDRISSSYALYYSERPEKVVKTIREQLKPEGIFFFCGPARNNNLELKSFHYGIKGEPIPSQTDGTLFMEETGQQIAREVFSCVEVVFFENPLRFDSAKALYEYWSSYNLYEEEMNERFREAAAKHFKEKPVFETRKRVIGIVARI